MIRLTRVAILIALLPALAGCDPHARNDRLKQALTNYNAGQYALAADQAQAAMSDSTGPARDEAAYVAGLSEYRMGNLNQAQRHLSMAAQSSNKAIAGRASAVLGTISVDQNRPREAAPLFAAAADSLEGEDARQAAQQAAAAYSKAGDSAAARQWSTRAGDLNTGGNTQAADRSRSSASGAAASSAASTTAQFALQVGAFRDREHAERAANDTAPLIARKGLGPARVIPSADERGRPLFLVQFGQFNSRGAAATTRQQLGNLSFIVAPLAVGG